VVSGVLVFLFFEIISSSIRTSRQLYLDRHGLARRLGKEFRMPKAERLQEQHRFHIDKLSRVC
jgi:hypothetical protein